MGNFHKLFVFVLLLVGGSGITYAGEVISDIQVIDLGTLPGGAHSTAADINDTGEIVGTSETTSGEDHAFIITIGPVMSDIGTLGGDRSSASGINDFGQVVGNSSNLLGVIHGFEWQDGVIRDLGAFPPQDDSGSESRAFAVNNSGLIAGHVDLAGVVWDLAGVPNFPPFPPYVRVTDPGPFSPAIALDINDAGKAAGTLLSLAQGFRWQAGVLEPLAVLQARDDDAFGINNSGQVVGRGLLATPDRIHAVIWPDPSTVLDLGTLGGDNSEAFDINDDGLVVGDSETTTGDTVAFVWRADLGIRSLGTLGGANSKAFAVNAMGQIVGESETSTGEVHATLWTITIATEVQIDIKPGSDLNSINPKSGGRIQVAILSSATFDAPTQVDQSFLTFGRMGDEPSLAFCNSSGEDVNSDGLLDLVCHFYTLRAAFQSEDAEAILKGKSVSGTPIIGSDSVRIVP
jgi:probable HAF family extracellular repeat protein